ncbi:MAG: hypothetical protein JSV91_12720 [Phycisphaerales bacterium]|nr:MAG: hypothetical protein JSV91_12720 [Phycisphaerales bacterium]
MTMLPKVIFLTPALLGLCIKAPASDELELAISGLESLDATVLSVDYEYEPLERVLEDLGDRIGVPVHGDWPTLDRLGVVADDDVTFRLSRGNASTVLAGLSLLLGDEFERPTFEWHAGRMVLTSFQGTAAMRLTDVYDLRDLLSDDAVTEQLRAGRPDPAGPVVAEEAEEEAAELEGAEGATADPESIGGGDDEGTGEDEPPDDEAESPWKLPDLSDLPAPSEPRSLSPGEELVALITEHIDPEAWINYGGNLALISERDGLVMVTAPPTMHRKLRNALARLRRVNPRGLSIETAIVDVPRDELVRLRRRYDASSAMLGRALMQGEDAIVLWRAESAVAIDHSAEIESRLGEAVVRLGLKPVLDKSTGSLSLTVEAAMTHGGDERSLKTTVAIPNRNGGAILELPPVLPGDSLRLLLLLPERVG